jgi:kynurenine formamidase
MQGAGAALALAAGGLSSGTVAAEGGAELSGVPALLQGMPDNWGRWGEDDELGALNLLGSEEMFEGMNAAMKRGKKGIERITLQTPITGNAIDALIGEGEFPTTDTGDPAFPGRLPARKNNTADWRNAASNTGLRFADDRFDTPLYMQGTSHVDALGHGWYADRNVADEDTSGFEMQDGKLQPKSGEITREDEQLYNGFSAKTTATERTEEYDVPGLQDTDGDGTQEAVPVGKTNSTYRLSKADISNAADAGIAGRGVLLDVGRQMGDEENGWLPLDYSITYEDLMDTADAQGVTIRERDILLVRTGAIERARDPEAPWHAQAEPGLTYSDGLLEWIAEMDIPYMAADNLPIEKVVQEVTEEDLSEGREHLAGTYVLPLHGALLRDLGVTLNEVLDLRELGAACAEDGIYEFLFTAAPLHVVGGTGGPVNPVVIKASQGGGPD